ncbi:hypothetical protein BHE74_00019022 [Ensete ventricosum]|nr:hypothetical protein GW17_00011632 [Ensete ventricosum]RWW73121.1 hypothetical protein BHE74_00019022 [Ensete ventricosum]RZS12912.1 hypothetical protein BHM03_00044418 [Ensete ventricosum]
MRLNPDPANVPHGSGQRYGFINPFTTPLHVRGLRGNCLPRSNHGRGIFTRGILAHKRIRLLDERIDLAIDTCFDDGVNRWLRRLRLWGLPVNGRFIPLRFMPTKQSIQLTHD